MSDHDFQMAKIRMLPEIQRVWQSIVALSNEWSSFNQYINIYVERIVWLATHYGTKKEVRIFEEFRKSDQPRIYAYVILMLIEIRAHASQESNGIAALIHDALKYMQEHADFYRIDDVFIDEINQILSQPVSHSCNKKYNSDASVESNLSTSSLYEHNRQAEAYQKKELAERLERKQRLLERKQQEQIELAQQIARNRKAVAERIEREQQAEKERIEREQQAEKERIERKRQAEKERIERKRQVEKERIERERQAKAEQIARERAERERIAQEQAEREREAQIQRAKYNAAAEKIWQVCAENFFAVDAAFQSQSVIPQSDLSKVKSTFLREWFDQHLPQGFVQPDNDQLNAIGSVHGNVQVIARAGSGKTSTLVYRVFFLIKHCRVNANEIMMLAFNRKAANEMRERLLRLLYPKVIPEYEKYKREYRAKMQSDQINEVSIVWDVLIQLSKIHDIPLPFIMTFHGLVHNIVNPSEQLIVDTSDPEGAIQSKVLQKLIDNHIRDYNIFGSSLRQLMMSLLDNGWDEIGKISYGFSRKEYVDYRRSINNIALKGHHVKSYGEKKIADYMFLHDVNYSYEYSITINQKRYRPDFMLKIDNKIIVIEYVGLVGMSDYNELLEQKRHAYGSQPNLIYIELTPDDVRDEQRFEHRMNTIFHQHDIEMRQLTNDEIWDLVKERAVDLFTRLTHNFIQKCRQLQISPAELRQRISSMITNNLEGEFANVACTFYQEYIDYCVDNNVIDFSTLMQRATQLIRDGKSDFSKRHSHGNITQIRFLSIDEFQDFSVLFYELLLAMRGINPTMQLFCVGDDWQAINRFAGADTRFFTDFERYIGPRTVCHITSNYRSAQQIVDFGNAVMHGRGVPAKAAKLQSGQVFVVYLDDFIGNSKEGEYFGWNNTQLTALSRLINIHVAKKQHVTVLSRASAPLDESLKKIRQLIDTKNSPNIMHSTTHGYKGLEQGSIILWDVTERQYPMVHSHWIFGRILGDTLEQIIEDERRLFYVGVTRASKSLFIMTRRQSMSQFLAEVMDISTVTEIDISTLSPMASLRSDLMILQLTGGTFAVKDAIKQHDYRWSSSTSGWRKQVRVAEFSASTLLRESWVAKANNITVTLIDETGAVLRTYLVNAGRISRRS